MTGAAPIAHATVGGSRYVQVVTITLATTNEQRAEVQALFSRIFVHIEENAVPAVEHHSLYSALIPQIHDQDGRLIAAAMACRTQIAASAVLSTRAGLPDPFVLLPLLDKHSELDLLAVDGAHRGRGFGTSLVEYLDAELVGRGVRMWFGNVIRTSTWNDSEGSIGHVASRFCRTSSRSRRSSAVTG